jgi:Tol biopolymer transport system component
MTPERWRQITEVFHAALARDVASRSAVLDEMCKDDTALRVEVDALLAAHGKSGGFGEAPAVTAPFESSRLQSGQALGPYRIESLLGAGGMGEVYKARDTRLDRAVAVKVLPAAMAGDSRFKQRLEREARALATLSHPHICPVFDVGEQDGIAYLVMEYLEGETLARRLARGPLPLGEALRRAVEIADALDKAHRQGIVHRDLKPGNVMLTKGGAKLLDFGIAKLRAAAVRGSDATTGPEAALTSQGMVLGTLQYMAPEQLGGEEADARTDIFAFGAVLYEMVTGQRVFQGKSRTEVMAAILEHEPAAISTIQPTSPPALDHLIRTCLAKDPDRRWHSAGDIGRHLTWLLGEGSTPSAGMTAQARGGRKSATWSTRALWLAAAVLGVVATLSGLKWLASERTPSPLLQTTLTAPPGVPLAPRSGFALSPDGDRLAFVARGTDGLSRLWLRALAASEARPLAGTEGALAPFWSPDGRDIGFFADQRLKRVPAAGGVVQVLAGPLPEQKGGAWSPDGRIVYAPDYRAGLFEVSAKGGQPRALTQLDVASGELSHRWPWFLPDGRTLLFLVQTAEAGAKDDRSRIEALDARGARHEILKANASAAYAPPGLLLFWRTGSIYAQPLDPERLRLGGEEKLVATDVDLNWSEWATFSVSGGGSLVYTRALPWRLEWRERSGSARPITAPEGEYANPALSPDGRRLAYVSGNTAVRILDLVRGTDTRLTLEGADHDAPAWAPDGDWVAYFANEPRGAGGAICRRRSSVVGEPEVLYPTQAVVRNLSWSPDGRWIAFEEGENILLLDMASRTPRPRISTRAFEGEPNFSPDGLWLAYTSDESGRLEVYLVPAFDGPGKWQVSTGGGYTPRWAPSGSALFFHGSEDNLKVVTITPGKEPKIGLPEPVFALPGGSPWRPVFDIAPDGRVLVTVQRSQGDSDSFRLVMNWPRLLEEPTR